MPVKRSGQAGSSSPDTQRESARKCGLRTWAGLRAKVGIVRGHPVALGTAANSVEMLQPGTWHQACSVRRIGQGQPANVTPEVARVRAQWLHRTTAPWAPMRDGMTEQTSITRERHRSPPICRVDDAVHGSFRAEGQLRVHWNEDQCWQHMTRG